MGIEVRNLVKHFGAFQALNDVSLRIPSGRLTALLGPSGSGKTTLLRIIAGLDFADSGQVMFHGEDAGSVHARERGVGFVFQHYALFRHLTVFENIAFPLRVKPRRQRPERAALRAKVNKLLQLVQLDFLADRYPSQLSGGQRQRVALARALAVEPRVLLLDEPFGALDARVRKELRRWLRRLHEEIQVTSVFVTHDQEEALEVADQVVVMNEGQIEQVGTPQEVYAAPETAFVYRFLGNVNLFRGRVTDGKVRVGGLEIDCPQGGISGEVRAVAYARPHEVVVERQAEAGKAANAEVLRVHSVGPLVRVELRTLEGGDLVEAQLSPERQADLHLRPGESVCVKLRNPRLFVDDAAA